jgi:type IV pilus assembly protein PilW
MRTTPLRRSAGFTLVEAMIGLALSSTIMLGISQLFAANSQTYSMLTGQSDMQQSARFALSSIATSVQSAGYGGCFSTNVELYKTFDNDLPYEYNIEAPMLAFEGKSTFWNPDIESILPRTIEDSGGALEDTNVYKNQSVGANTGIDTNAILRGTDIITLNYVSQQGHQLTDDMPESTEDIDLVTTDFSFGVDHLVHISDCEKQSVFRATGLVGGLIQHGLADDDGGGPANDYTNNFTRLAAFNSFGNEDTSVAAIVSDTYYVAEGTSINRSGQKTMSLWRKSSIQPPTELVNGIEDLQIKYGIDTNVSGSYDNIPNKYVNADQVTSFLNVISIRISVVANSIDDVDANAVPTYPCGTSPTGQYCKPGLTYDGMLRRKFTETIALRNRQQ